MDFSAVLAQLKDLPATFQPQGNPYAQLIGALASSEAQYTNGADATAQQAIAFSNAIDGWIDVWGLLVGVPRNQGEGNIPYAMRITETVLAWVGTLPAIQVWINMFAPGGSVAEIPAGGYVIKLPASMNAAQGLIFINSLGRIRPVGVPFTVQQQGTGLFLGTEGFLGDGTVVGTYLVGTAGGVVPAINATTLSSQPLIPDLFLVDPNLAQPGLLSLGLQGVWPPQVVPVGEPPYVPPVPAPPPYPFWNNGGVLTLLNPGLLVSSPDGQPADSFWSNGGEVTAVGPVTPVAASALYYGTATLTQLAAIGPAGLPAPSGVTAGSFQLYLNGGVVCIA